MPDPSSIRYEMTCDSDVEVGRFAYLAENFYITLHGQPAGPAPALLAKRLQAAMANAVVPGACAASSWHAVVQVVLADAVEMAMETRRKTPRDGLIDPEAERVARDWLGWLEAPVAAFAVARFVHGYSFENAASQAIAPTQRSKVAPVPAWFTRYFRAYEATR